MSAPTFQALTEQEIAWLDTQLEAASQFLGKHAPEQTEFTLAALDEAWANWLETQPEVSEEIQEAIQAVGVGYGAILVATNQFSWCIATDDWGTDLAVRALPEEGDVLVFPTDFVAKRWESKSVSFLEGAYDQTMEYLEKIKIQWSEEASQLI